MEKLFTEKQLQEIQTKATQDFERYHDTYVIDGNSNEVTIITISKLKYLVFVEGNEDTGFEHLSNRHSYFSHKNYWRLNNDKKYKLDDPSKFRKQIVDSGPC